MIGSQVSKAQCEKLNHINIGKEEGSQRQVVKGNHEGILLEDTIFNQQVEKETNDMCIPRRNLFWTSCSFNNI
jgi:hypothetical protein